MGIKFRCHACGHKLNVKSFLAGKRGICPKCGAKLQIPADEEAGGTPMTIPSGEAESAQPEAAAVPLAVPMGPAAGSPTTPVAARPHPVSSATPMRPGPPTPVGGPTTAMPGAPARAATTYGGATPGDPIAEAPQAGWYVRPPSGGQFGPAVGDVMRRWLAEGRVSADSMVWREGWADWRNAGATFPSLGGGSAAVPAAAPVASAMAPIAGALPTTPSQSVARSYRTRGKKSNLTGLTMVIVLILASIGLLVGLVAVVLTRSGG